MNKKVIFILFGCLMVLCLLFVSCIGLFVLVLDNDELNSVSDQESYLEEVAEHYEDMEDDLMVQMDGSLTSITPELTLEMDMTIVVDGDNADMMMGVDDAKFYIRSIGEDGYISNGGTWYKMPVAAAGTEGFAPVEADAVTNFGAELANENFTYDGYLDCEGSDGMCQVFTFEEEDGTSKMYINEDMEIVRMEMDGAESDGYFDVSYDDVSVSAPEEFEELSEEEATLKMFELMMPLLSASGYDMEL